MTIPLLHQTPDNAHHGPDPPEENKRLGNRLLYIAPTLLVLAVMAAAAAFCLTKPPTPPTEVAYRHVEQNIQEVATGIAAAMLPTSPKQQQVQANIAHALSLDPSTYRCQPGTPQSDPDSISIDCIFTFRINVPWDLLISAPLRVDVHMDHDAGPLKTKPRVTSAHVLPDLITINSVPLPQAGGTLNALFADQEMPDAVPNPLGPTQTQEQQ